MGGILSYLLIKLTGVDREVVEKWLYVIVGLTFLSGILGTGHHYYFITPRYWLWIGGIFSALEPLAFLGMAMYAVAMVKRGGRQHPNTSPELDRWQCHHVGGGGRIPRIRPYLAAGQPVHTAPWSRRCTATWPSGGPMP